MANNGNTKKSTKAEQRRYRAFEMNKAGYSYRQIAEAFGVSRTQAFKDVKRVLKELAPPTEDVQFVRDREVQRLTGMIPGFYPNAIRGDEKAANMVLRISRQIAELTGANSPEKIEHSGVVGVPKSITDWMQMINEHKPK
jgi:hypothetical protein